jgi:excisionase family DNA binding protein
MTEPSTLARPCLPGVDPSEWLTLGEAKAVLAVCGATVRRLVERGLLPATRTVAGGRYWFKKSDVNKYLADLNPPVPVTTGRAPCPNPTSPSVSARQAAADVAEFYAITGQAPRRSR